MENGTSNKIFYNKLVRDKIQDKIESKGEQCEVREITDDNEFQQELLKRFGKKPPHFRRCVHGPTSSTSTLTLWWSSML